jgi:hypothetical protein
MHRTQISLQEIQYERLLHEAQRLGISLSELIRRLADDYFAQHHPTVDPLSTLAGIGHGDGQPVGREHNRFLYGSKD